MKLGSEGGSWFMEMELDYIYSFEGRKCFVVVVGELHILS
jgi:hypothetical protein